MISYEDAIDDIFAQINTEWIANTPDITGNIPTLYWQGVEEPNPESFSSYWGRVSQQTVLDEQAGFRNGSCGQSYTNEGLVFVQIFCPKSDAQSMEKGRKLAIVARDAYRGKSTSGKVWFRKVTINEIPPEGNWYRFNVVAEYEYDEQIS